MRLSKPVPTQAEEPRLAQNAALAALIVAAGAGAVAVLELVFTFLNQQWHLGVAGIASLVFTIAALFAHRLSRQGRSEFGLGMLFYTGPLLFLVHVALFSGAGLALAVGILVVLVSGPPVILPGRYTGRMIFLGIASGFLILLVDGLSPEWRIASPASLQILILAACGGIVVLNSLLLARQFTRLALTTKLILFMVGTAILATTAVAFLTIRLTRQALLDLASSALTTAASRAAGEVEDYLASNLLLVERESQFTTFSLLLNLPLEDRHGLPLSEAGALLYTLASQTSETGKREYVQAYTLLDTEGRVVASTEVQLYGETFAGYDYFEQAISSEKPYISNLEFTPDGQARLYFTKRVMQYGRPVGVLVRRVNAMELQTLMEQQNGLAGTGSFGILLDSDHMRLGQGDSTANLHQTIVPLPEVYAASLQASRRLPSRPLEELSTQINQLESGLRAASEQPDFAYTEPISGERFLASTARLSGAPWQLVYVQPEGILLQPVENQARLIEILALAVAGMAALLAIGLAHVVATPVQRLTQTAGQIISGDLAARAPVESDDEVGRLAEAFNSMTERLHELIANLEERVIERTRELERRSRYLEASAQVGRAATSILDPQELVRASVDLICQEFGLYYAGLFLTDEEHKWAVLRAGTGPAGEAMLRRGHRLAISESSMIGWAIFNGRARIAQEASQDIIRQATPELPKTRSEAALPLRSRDRVLGAISVQSEQPNAFDDATLVVLQTMADQLATVLDNARLYTSSQESLEAARRISDQTTRRAWQDLLNSRLASGYISSELGLSPVPSDLPPEAEQALALGRPVAGSTGKTGERSSLAVPIKVRGEVVGVLETHKASETGWWTEEEITLMQSLTEQLSVALDSARLYQETQQQAERERLVSEITARMRETLEIDSVLKTAASEIYQALDLKSVVIKLENPK